MKRFFFVCFKNFEHIIGESVSAMIAEIPTAPAKVKANSVNNAPVKPPIKPMGTYTAINTTEIAKMGPANSVVLIAVYVPIGFMGGLTGALFTEFAFTLAGAVGISAVIALTLSPMMCSKFLKVSDNGNNKFLKFMNHHFQRLEKKYEQLL